MAAKLDDGTFDDCWPNVLDRSPARRRRWFWVPHAPERMPQIINRGAVLFIGNGRL